MNTANGNRGSARWSRWAAAGRRNRYGLLLAVLALGVTGLVLLTVGAPLWLDDVDQLQYVRTFDSIGAAVTQPDCYGFYRPFKNVLFLGFARGGRFAPAVRHGITWASYLLASLLFVQYARRLFRHRGWAATCGLVWALAPTQVSTLAWFSCSNIVVMAVLILGGMLLVDLGKTWAIALAGLCFLLAVLAYEAAIAFPALLVLHDEVRGRRWDRRRVVRVAGFGLVAVAALAIRHTMAGRLTMGGEGFSPMSAAQTSAASAYFFLDHLAWWWFPIGRQEILGTFVWGKSVPFSVLVVAWVVLLGLIAVVLCLRKKAPLISFGMLWYVVAFAPTSNLAPLGNGPVADYYLVLPSMGFAIALVAAARRIAEGMQQAERGSALRKTAAATLGLVGLWRGAMVVTAFGWASVWRHPAELLQRSVQAGPYAFRARANLARRVKNAGYLEEALTLARQSAREAPWYELSHNVLGDVATQQGDYRMACTHYRRALQAAPDSPYPAFALAYVYETHLDQPEEAATRYERVLALAWNPYSEKAALNLARLRAMDGQVDEAIRIMEKALKKVPDSRTLGHNLRIAYRQKEQSNED